MSTHASLNRHFRLVWNDVSGTWVAVSEVARGRTKRSGRAARRMAEWLAASALASQAWAAPPPNQLPTGGSVAAGSATLRGTPGGAVLNVDQSSQRAVINWSTFDIGSAAQVNFNQPGASAVTLNRVLGSDASQIAGRITAPGQVFLTNPNGIVFGKTATVDVGGLTATTLGIGDADFMAGKTNFTRGATAGSVVNEGTLQASLGGYIALLAPEVRNQGVVVARLGTVALAAGDAVNLDFDANSRLAGITVQASAVQALVDNRGAVLAPGGLIVLSAQALDRLQGGVVNNSGQVEATGFSSKAGRIVLEASDRAETRGSLRADAGSDGPAGSVSVSGLDVVAGGVVSAVGTAGQGGSVALVAQRALSLADATVDASGSAGGGTLLLQGGATPVDLASGADAPGAATLSGSTRLLAAGGQGAGGRIAVTADTVELLDQTRVDATGATGGGTVQVGGGYQGSGGLAQARRLRFADGATIDASATGRGNGGTVSLWTDIRRTDSQTIANGTLTARGGALGGDGGKVETSGHRIEVSGARVDASAAHGASGDWLLDPYDVTISTATAVNNVGWAPTGSGSILNNSDLQGALNAGTSITVTTGSNGSERGDINVNATIAKTAGADATLTLRAANTITLNSAISSSTGKLNLVIDADNDMGTRDGAGIVILNSNLGTNGGSIAFGTGATMSINGVTTKVGGDVYVGGSSAQTLTTSGGAITVNGEMIIANTSGLSLTTSGGNVTFGGLLNSGNTYTLVDVGSNTLWTTAYAAAKGSTAGAAAVGDTYLATITSRLENAVASRAANYTSAWLGGRRGVTTANASTTAASDSLWRWVTGPEGQANGGTGLVFWNGANGGSSVGTAYTNWNWGEPNNSPGCTGCTNESAAQFVGSFGRWNDLWPGAGQTGVTTYLRETNLAGSPLTINAGAGTVTFTNMVGGNKALGSLNVTAGTVAINGGGVTSEGAQTYNGAVTLGSAATVLTQTTPGTTFTLPSNRSIVNATGADATLTIKTTDAILLSSGSTIHSSGSAKLSTVLWADTDANGGLVAMANGDATWGNVNTNGGDLWIGGGLAGSTFNGLAVGSGAAKGVEGTWVGIWLTGSSLQSGAGSIWMNGEGGGGGKANYGVFIDGGTLVSSTTGSISVTGQGSRLVGTSHPTTTNNEGVKLDRGSVVQITSGNGNLSLTGYGGTGTDYNIGVNVRGGSTVLMGAAATGTMTVTGTGGAAATGTGNWGVLAEATGVYTTPSSPPLSGTTATLSQAGSGNFVSMGAASIVLQGTAGAGSDSYGIRANGAGVIGNAAMTGGITLRSDTMQLVTSPVASILGNGALNIQTLTPGTTIGLGGGAGTLNLTQSALTTFRDGFSAINIGRSDGTGTITVGSATLTDDTQLLTSSGAIQITGALNVGTNRLTLTSGGNVTEGSSGSVQAGGLLLQGTGSKVLGNTANAVTTLAANGGSLGYVNSTALTLGDVGTVSGVQASGAVSIATLAGDLTVARNVSAGDTGTAAVVLNAGQTAAAGTATGGNLVISGSPAITTGSGGRATLMTGSVSGSTGLAALVGSGSGRFRYYSDEAATNYTAALGSGLYAIYRERPVLTVTAGATKVYDGVAYSGGGTAITGYVNGDTSASVVGSPTYGGTAQGATSAGTYTLTASGLTNSLGYGYTYVAGSLTITPRPVSLTGTRVYDGTTTVASSLLGLTNLVAGQTLTFTGSATLADKNAGTQAITSFSGLTLGGAFAANYTLAGASGSVTLTPRPVSLTGSRTYDGTTAIAGSALTVANLVGSDVVSLSGSGTLADKNAGSRAISSVGTLALGGASAANYTVFGASGSVTVTPRAVSLTGSRVYDGTTAIASSALSLTNLVGGDSLSLSGSGTLADKNAGTRTIASVSGLTLGGTSIANYTLVGASGSVTLTPRPVSLAGGRTYNGTTAIAGSALTVANLVGGDVLSVSGSGTLADKNVGSRVISSFGTLALGGASAANYTLVGGSGSATLTQAALTVSAPGGVTKTYDGTTTAQGAAVVGTLAGAAAGEVVGTAPLLSYTDAHAGTGKTVQASGAKIVDALGADVTTNYAVTYLQSSTGVITKAPLTVTANDDARFVAQADNPAYYGVHYSGLVGNETASVLGGTLSISRPNAANDVAAGTYANALVPSGLSSGDYTITYAPGSYTIVPANQLLVRVGNSSAAYGSSPSLAPTSVQYLDGNSSTIVNLTGSLTGNTYTYSDGAGGSVAFTLAPQNPAQSSSGRLAIGNYAVAATSPTIGGTNFTALTFVGNLAVTRAALTPTASNVSKVYDGTTEMNGVTLGLTGSQSGDVLSVSGIGAFSQKNAGTGLSYSIAGLALGGADANNYYLSGGSTFTGTNGVITPASLTVGGSLAASDKVYDGTRTATLVGTPTVNGFGADSVTLGGTGVAIFADKNVATGKAVTVSGYTLTGTDASNYTLVQPTGLTASITPASLLLGTGTLAASNKVYDGSTAATLSGAPTVTAFGSDVVNLVGTGTGAFTDKNVGTGKAVTVGGYTLTGTDASNYTLVQPTGITASITPASLTVGGTLAAANKVYDGSATATLSGAPTVTALGSDAVAIGGTGVGSFADKSAATNKAVTVSGYVLTGADAGNYTLVQPTGLTATITPASLLLGAGTLAASDKVYDGLLTATLSGAPTVAAFGSDVVSLAGTGAGTFTDKNVGTNKFVTVSGYTLTGTDASNYTLVQPTSLTASITPASLLVGGTLAASNKVYDGSTTATLSGAPTVTAFGSDVVNLVGTGTGAFTDKNVGTGKAVTVGGYTLTGTDASNYTLVPPTGLTASITPANLLVGGTLAAANKVYDGSTAATLSGAPTVTALGSDVVNLVGTGVGAFADKNVGTGKAVTVGGYTLTGTDASNYTLVQPTGLTASITPASLTVGGTLAASNKVYDGSTTATLSGAPTVTALGSDAVAIGGTGVGSFADKSAGTNKSVTVSGYVLTGADAGNYTLVQPTGLTATITPVSLLLGAGTLAASNKVYDGTITAALSGAPTLTALGSDVVSLAGTGAGTFTDKNVGASKAVTVSGYVLAGTDAGNYTLVQPTGLTASITPASLLVGGTLAASNKVYDGSTTATLSGAPTVTAFGSDAVTIAGTGTARFADKNAGTNKAVTVSGYTLTGADAGNYTLVEPGLHADIAPRPLGVSAAVTAKVYDGSTLADVALADDRVAGDVLSLAYGAAAFASKNAGTGKAVNITGIQATGADAANYGVASSATGTGDVAQAQLRVTASGSAKTYDATTRAEVTLSDNRVAGDSLVLGWRSANFADKTAGLGKTVVVDGISVTGADAGNYRYDATATTTADVAKATLTVGAVAQPRSADGTTTATVTLTDNRFSGDQLQLSYASATVADASAGTGKAVSVTGIRIAGGADQGNYLLGNSSASALVDILQAAPTSTVPTVLSPAPAAAATPAAPSRAADWSLPGGGATATAAGSAVTPASTLASPVVGETGTVQVALVSAHNDGGAVSVSVPRTITSAGTGFSFPLPTEVAQVAGSENARVSLLDGAPLPSWLSYSGSARAFSATSAPAGALPVEIMVRIGAQQWTVTVTERAGN